MKASISRQKTVSINALGRAAGCVIPRLHRAALAVIAALALTQAATATDLKDVFEAAKANDAVIGAARAQYEAARQALPQARSGLLPQVSAQGATSWNELSFPVGPQFNPDTGLFEEVPDQQYNDHSWSATLNQPIVNFSAWFTYTSAKAAVEQAKTALDAAEQNLIVRATEAYLNVLRAQDLLDSTQAAEAAVKRQLEQVQQRFDVGLVAITDVLEAQAAYDDALVNRIQADGDHDIFFENLRTLTGTAYDSLSRLSEELPIVNPAPADEEQWVQTALITNYGVKGAQHAVAAAARTLRSRRSDHLPTLGASALRNHDVTGGPSFLGGKTDVTRYSLTLNVPIFSGGLVRSRARQASAELEGARQQLLDAQRTVARDTRNLFRAVATDVVRVRARQRAIESSQSALDATETGYEVGTRNIVDVLQAQQRLFGSQFDYADSRYRYVLDLMRLKQSTGTLSDEDLYELNTFADPNDQVETLPSLRRYSGDLGS
ncbi:MAG: TolC family outer membrane protein [Pseudomonadaceae bacterium]|nr:TolC family outer membrane protein [Pseudomonadaceae bacterium]